MELFNKDAKPIVQNPPPGKFSSFNVQWQYLRLSNSPYPVQQVCHIPFDRVADFIRGESENPEHPTNFRIYSSRRRRRQSKTSAITYRTYSEELTYWCVYGPDTKPRKHRKASNSSETKRTRPRITPSRFQKGCGCHFIVHRLVLMPDAARISYVHPHHTNDDDIVCHAVDLDRLKMGLGIVAPWLSSEIKRWVIAMLCAGFTVQQIFDRHVRALHERRQRNVAYQISRDDFLTSKDVENIAKQIDRIRQEVHNIDALSTRLWCLLNKGEVFVYQEHDLANNMQFIFGLQTNWQLEMMLKYGHDQLLAMNSTLRPHQYKFYLYTILVFDQHQNAIPVAWVLSSSCCGLTMKQWLQELCNRASSLNSEWRPNAFAIDDADIDTEIIRSVFSLPILFCMWHVRRTWLKKLICTVKSWSIRTAMFNALGHILDVPNRSAQANMQRLRPSNLLVNEFLTQFADQDEFITYFRESWQKKIDTLILAAQTLNHANQETNASIEVFYTTLKQRFLKGKRNIQGRPTDWLFHLLTTEVVPFFWYQHHLKENESKNPSAISSVPENSVTLALRIPDSDVRYPRNVNFSNLGPVAHVRSQSKRDIWYEVFYAQPGWSCCNCDWAAKGNICKHQIKVMLMDGIPISSTISNYMGLSDENFSPQENLHIEPAILEQEAYQEPQLSNFLLRDNTVHSLPCKGLEEDIQRLQQQSLQLAGGNFSLLQLLRDDAIRTQQMLLEARSGSLDVIPQASPQFRTM